MGKKDTRSSPFLRIGIIGLGVIGGSIAQALKERGLYVASVKSDSSKRKRLPITFATGLALHSSRGGIVSNTIYQK